MPDKVVKEVPKTRKVSAPKKKVVKKIEDMPLKKTPVKTPAKPEMPMRRPLGNVSSTERILVENFVGLQKVMTNLAMKFEELSTQISKLLELFEISAKSVAGKDFDTGRIEKKIDSILDQNRTIARGVSLIHEPMEENTKSERPHPTSARFKPWPK